MERPILVGAISDTHGTLDPRVLDEFAGVAHILHAGDVGGLDVLNQLETIAPVTAVRGNTDNASMPWLELQERLQVAGCPIRILHDLDDAGGRIPSATRVVVSGHTHVAYIVERGGVLFVNPGSASEPRGGAGPSVAILEIVAGTVRARIVML